MKSQDGISRRKFVAGTLGVGSTLLMGTSITWAASPLRDPRALTIQNAIDMIIGHIPGGLRSETVDTVKSGDPSQPLTGVVTTMFATVDVIRKAIELKANLIIAHEPTFYNHADETAWLESHEVFRFKKDLLTKNNIVVWRFHDYWHAHRPDGIAMGVLKALGWVKYYHEEDGPVLRIPPTTVKSIIELAKKNLGINKVKLVGNLGQVCETVGLLPGAMGGRGHMQLMQTHSPDLLIVGELQEWETSEYFRDLRAMGRKQSLLVLGHSVSEEPGMQWLVSWLQPKLSSVKVTHVPSGDPFLWV